MSGAERYPERERRAERYPERKRRPRHAAAPDGIEPVADAPGSDLNLDPHRQLSATTTAIDQLVNELYGLTDDETRIVEQATER